jgi:glutathione S-transferase
MPLKFYGSLLSQPCRAIWIFLKANEIPYEFKFIDMTKGMLLNIECDNIQINYCELILIN